MPDLPKKKVGIVSCSGEELPEGTVTRLAALKVLEQLRPADTVTICLPLFLAGGEGDRAFAKFYPTIAIDGCDKRCAARGTEMYSGKPAASIVISELVAERGLGKPEGKRRLNEAGQQVVDATAGQVAELVDELLQKNWNRTAGAVEETAAPEVQEAVQATCSCGSGIPVQDIVINGQTVTLIALPLIFQQFRDSGKPALPDTIRELLESVKIYNPIPPGEEDAYAASLSREYAAFCEQPGAVK
ncbi:MAG: putative zinc-binding protein [Chloroflexi bacterium]|nr:putative zinc-binding protein [Chloroflexota bacterium]